MRQVSRRSVLMGAVATAGASATDLAGWWTPASAQTPSGTDRRAALDVVVFGDSASEATHSLRAELSETVQGGLGQPARVLKPRDPVDWWGGTTAFTLAVDPEAPNYLSVKFYGGDFADNGDHAWRLQVFLAGQVLGWFDQCVVDSIDLIDVAPRLPGRFFCHTLPLPETHTRGKTALEIEIRAMGRIWPYGNTPSTFYYPMTTPSRGLYRAYTHTAPHFLPAADDDFGTVGTPSVRQSTDAAMIDAIRARVLKDQTDLLYSRAPASMDGWAYLTLLNGYYWPGSPAYQNPDALERVCQAIDGRYLAWQKDSTVLTGSDQQWEGFGRVGLVLCTAWDDVQQTLDRNVTSGPANLSNPGFEAGTTTPVGWVTVGWANNGTFSRDAAIVHSGTGSLKVVSAGSNMLVVPAARGRTAPGLFSYSCWVKTDGTAKTPHVLAQFWNDANQYVGGSKDHYVTAGTADWQQLTETFTVPAGATQYEFWMVNTNGETAWFDDVQITAPPPVEPNPVARREAYRDMMLASREYWRQHQRHYSNQAQFTAIGIYECNRGLALLSPADAWPDEKAKSWVYQSVGLQPWSGPETVDGQPTWTLGHDYFVVTPKGLTRELGYVADYGEVSAMLVRIYEAVTTGKGGAPDDKLRQWMIQMIRARSWFRYPAEDQDGNRAMRIETQIGWRNEPYPGDVVYAQRTDWDGHPIEAAAVFGDPQIVGWCQEMVADGQLAPQLELLASNGWDRVGLNAFRFVATDLPAFQALPASASRLPGRWDAPDFVFTDEVNGCLAVKRGKEIFYASLYWRARQGVNDLARVHLVTPQSQTSATVRECSVFHKDPNNTYTVQDWVAWDFAINDSGNVSTVPAGGYQYPGPVLHQALAGQTYYLAPIPTDVPDPALGSTVVGVEKVLVGKAPFYTLEYAGYLVAMNTTTDQTFTYRSGRTGRALDLRTGRMVPLGRPIRVAPLSTVVLFDAVQREETQG